MVRKLALVFTLIGGLTASASAQHLFQQKDLSFAQVAAGPTIETVLTLTNRGDQAYNGTFLLSQGLDGLAWNPLINGERITDGSYSVTVDMDAIVTLHITDDTLIAGEAVLVADNLLTLDNFVEGTLTYFIRSGDTITDSVGVAPGQEFYLASLPFDDFHDIALALANAGFTIGDTPAPTVDAYVTLIDPQGLVVGTKIVTLVPGAQQAQFLHELFAGVEGIGDITAGKIEVSALTPIVGTALTQVAGGQISSLPLNPAPVEYALDMQSDGGDTFQGAMALWVEGFFVKGYIRMDSYNGQNLEASLVQWVSGSLAGRDLVLSLFALSQDFFTGTGTTQDLDMSVYFRITDFGLESADLTGNWVLTYVADRTTTGGTLTLARQSPAL
ncbi:MAG: hypothetical protein P8020_17195 [Acidobacteriota bacterium]